MNNYLNLLLWPSLFMMLHLMGLVLAIVFWKRSPAACTLLLIAVVLNAVATIARVPFLYMVQEGMISPQVFGWAMMGISGVSWLGYATMIGAAVVGRNRSMQLPQRRRTAADDEMAESANPMPKAQGSTGIQEY